MHDNHKVRKAYRKHMLAQICTLPEEKFGRAFGMQTVYTEQGPAGADYYHFRDNGSRVLAVAHLDTVVGRHQRAAHFHNTRKGPLVMSGALDDRLGAYVILGLLPRLGVNCDVLLTVGEEWGESTATYFEPAKEYDWIIEFDRTGTDVVMYQYEDEPSVRLIETSGADVGIGSFSDIAYLEHVGVKAFNWGVGYQGNYHSVHGFAYLNDTFAMVAKYARFHKRNAGTVMKHVPAPARVPAYAGTYGASWTQAKDGLWHEECCSCFALDSIDSGGYCRECGYCVDCQTPRDECQCYTSRSLRDWKADAEGETADDAIAGARAAWETSTGTGWAGAEVALQASTGQISYGEAERRLDAIADARAAFGEEVAS
jgi:hypothetical protein